MGGESVIAWSKERAESREETVQRWQVWKGLA